MTPTVVRESSRQIQEVERNYLVHGRDFLAMTYALVKLRVYLLSEKDSLIYKNHTYLRTATKCPHLSQRMARWLLFFAEYNFVVFHKPG